MGPVAKFNRAERLPMGRQQRGREPLRPPLPGRNSSTPLSAHPTGDHGTSRSELLPASKTTRPAPDPQANSARTTASCNCRSIVCRWTSAAAAGRRAADETPRGSKTPAPRVKPPGRNPPTLTGPLHRPNAARQFPAARRASAGRTPVCRARAPESPAAGPPCYRFFWRRRFCRSGVVRIFGVSPDWHRNLWPDCRAAVASGDDSGWPGARAGRAPRCRRKRSPQNGRKVLSRAGIVGAVDLDLAYDARPARGPSAALRS